MYVIGELAINLVSQCYNRSLSLSDPLAYQYNVLGHRPLTLSVLSHLPLIRHSITLFSLSYHYSISLSLFEVIFEKVSVSSNILMNGDVTTSGDPATGRGNLFHYT